MFVPPTNREDFCFPITAAMVSVLPEADIVDTGTTEAQWWNPAVKQETLDKDSDGLAAPLTPFA